MTRTISVGVRVRIAGHVHHAIEMRPYGVCEEITDGVTFDFVDHKGDTTGCWIVDYADFERMYLVARACRGGVGVAP